jgi:hypothetical protein
MGLSDNVAIVALVVSLVALVLATGQALQQFLGTAEGYRRCARAVIGPWHRLRWRHFVWAEFRYETHYVTPEFMLLSADELEDTAGRPHILTKVPVGLKPSARAWKLFKKHSRDDVIANAEAVLSRSLQIYDSDYGDHTGTARRRAGGSKVRSDASRSSDEEKGNGNGKSVAMRGDARSKPKPLLQSQNRASWLLLLQRTHAAYQSYRTSKQPRSTLAHSAHLHVPAKYEELNLSSRPANNVETMICVTFLECVWDIMPMEVTKPLAKTTMGELVILATRMGMQWRSLQINGAQLLADGNGYSLTFTETTGLGLIAKLSSTGRQEAPPEMIPSRAADKMMCGILPGCAYLVDQDIPCVGDDRKVTESLMMRKLCARLETGRTLFDFWEKAPRKWCEPQNEAIVLLSEFLPAADCSSTEFYFWGWASNRQSCFEFWEARFAFWRHLKRHSMDSELDEALSEVLRYLGHFRDTYHYDFYSIKAKIAAAALDGPNEEHRRQRQCNLIEDCRRTFEWTTAWLMEHDFFEWDESSNDWSFRTWCKSSAISYLQRVNAISYIYKSLCLRYYILRVSRMMGKTLPMSQTCADPITHHSRYAHDSCAHEHEL